METLSKNAIAVTVGRDGPVDALLPDPPEEGDTARLLLRETGEDWEWVAMPCAVLGTTFGLVLVGLVERGADFQHGALPRRGIAMSRAPPVVPAGVARSVRARMRFMPPSARSAG
ncbi:MAG: hypothetical protein MZW92_35785 [Comamonadaceae bacterium]|nr:hypothetical protein [Comamonadaceae bacterium]